MASKDYAYYNKGNKIAVVEKEAAQGGGFLSSAHCSISGYSTKDTCEAAGGTWIPSSSGDIGTYGTYKSPLEDVEAGLEIEYSYAPTYRVNGGKILGVDRFLFPFWANYGGVLAFIRPPSSGALAPEDLTAAPFNSITASTAQDDDYILVEGSGIWDGIHKVAAVSSEGVIRTTTKIKGQTNFRQNQAIDFSSSANAIYDGTGSEPDDWLGFNYSAGDYIYVTGSNSNGNNGVWQIDEAQELPASLPNSYVVVTTKKVVTSTASKEITSTTATSITTETDQTDIDLLQVYPIFNCFISADVEIMHDEDFDIDITRYQANALINYIKGRLAEDAGDLERMQFYMREFKRGIEKSASARKYGMNIVQGFWGMRNAK